MGYREHAPPAALEPWLECLWEREAVDASPQRVLPDGCIDVVWTEAAGTRLVGANTTAFLVSLRPGMRIAGARLRPGAAVSLLGIAAESVRDARLPLEAVWREDGARLAAALDEQPNPVAGLTAALLERAARAEQPDPLFRAVVARLRQPGIGIAAVAGELGLSDRHLRRRITAGVGYGPKLLARVLRLQRALAVARAGGELARAAYDAGYADHAHFANDCRILAGAPPSALVAAPSPFPTRHAAAPAR
jgi:AraC-like DNA-binding protein